jgi:hypothetical protein
MRISDLRITKFKNEMKTNKLISITLILLGIQGILFGIQLYFANKRIDALE